MSNILRPIPDLSHARELKEKYRGHPIDSGHPLYVEPLVPISDYGVEGVSYYSQPNDATIEPVQGVSPNIFVRKSVAEKLAKASEFLIRRDDIAALFGERIGLEVKEGFRSPVLQAYLHDILIPQLIRSQHPDWTEPQIAARIKQVIAYPQWSATSMPPHFTGGAVDLRMKRMDTGRPVDTAQGKVELGKHAIHTDYLERMDRRSPTERFIKALQARRVLYNVMTSEDIGGVAMQNNPTETWHYSLNDQMWAILGRYPTAFYGVPPDIPDELQLTEVKT